MELSLEMENLFSMMTLPELDFDNPELWFAQLRVIFTALCIVCQKTKFGIAMSSLKLHPLEKIRNYVNSINLDNFENCYDTLEKAICIHFKKTVRHKIICALSLGSVSECKMRPSVYKRHLDQILVGVEPMDFVKETMLRLVPAKLRRRINISATCDQIALEVDSFLDINGKLNA